MLAYLDAGSASVMVSAVAAGVGGAAVAMRGALGRFKRTGKKADPDALAPEESTVEVDAETDA